MSVFGSPSFDSSDPLTGCSKYIPNSSSDQITLSNSASSSNPVVNSDPSWETDRSVNKSDHSSESDRWSLSASDLEAISRPTYTDDQLSVLQDLGLLHGLSDAHVRVPAFILAPPCTREKYKRPVIHYKTPSGTVRLPHLDSIRKRPVDNRDFKSNCSQTYAHKRHEGDSASDIVHIISLPRDLHSDDLCTYLGFTPETAIELIYQFRRQQIRSQQTTTEASPKHSRQDSSAPISPKTVPAVPVPPVALQPPQSHHNTRDDLFEIILNHITSTWRAQHAHWLPPISDPTHEWGAYDAARRAGDTTLPRPERCAKHPSTNGCSCQQKKTLQVRKQVLTNCEAIIDVRSWLVHHVGLETSAAQTYIEEILHAQGVEQWRFVGYLRTAMREKWDLVRLARRNLGLHLAGFENEARVLLARDRGEKVTVVPGGSVERGVNEDGGDTSRSLEDM